ncbi:MAG: 50S ribosomal protein L27 [Candidatus Omnitrophica bacterium]|nr:50S ribosomal protein L27 [Candidatus Omnitrophota bacterium]
MRKGGLSHINYKETRGLKVSSGEEVRKGAILTREGGKWKPGIHVGGRGTLYALETGKVYFTKRRATYKTRRTATVINIGKIKEKKIHK